MPFFAILSREIAIFCHFCRFLRKQKKQPNSIFLSVKMPSYNFLQLGREMLLVPGEGLEPSRPCGQRILSPLRLPFRHPGVYQYILRSTLTRSSIGGWVENNSPPGKFIYIQANSLPPSDSTSFLVYSLPPSFSRARAKPSL